MRPSRDVYLLRSTHAARTSGISQRDPNYYDFWNEPATQQKVISVVTSFWKAHIKGKWERTQGDCTSLYAPAPRSFISRTHG